jgi:hypothetical protein
LPSYDEEIAGPNLLESDLCLIDCLGLACAFGQIRLYPFDLGLEGLEILALFAIGDFFGCALFRTRRDMAQLRDVVWCARRDAQFREQGIVA